MDRKTLEEKLNIIRKQKVQLEAEAQAAYNRLIGAENALIELLAEIDKGEEAGLPKDD